MQNGPRSYNAARLVISDCQALPTRMRPMTREITELEVAAESQGRGDATALMHLVCDEADRESITLVLNPNPFGDHIAMSHGQLGDWYTRRFGFVCLPGSALMARMPWSTPRYLTPLASAVACYGQ